ncbi:hypothetical protein FRC17_000681, partial [Serendipita sp. 399]
MITKPPQVQLQDHLYKAFLTGQTADVVLRVSGNWNAVYKLHRIVLTQADFFRSLFTSGFVESNPNTILARNEVRIRFDHDPNITRAVTHDSRSICLAHLYGGGPGLWVCPSLKATVQEPLTSAYTKPSLEKPRVPNDHHPCSPRFLLSLLSTAFYLSIPTLTSEVLSLILLSIGPLTVARYLDYSLGKGIGPPNPGFVELERAVTLEGIGEDVDSESIFTDTYSIDRETTDGEPSLEENDTKRSEMTTSRFTNEMTPSYSYGAISNKIGEACAAFLARWGVDLLQQEEEQRTTNSTIAPTPLPFSAVPGPLTDLSSSGTSNWRPTSPRPRIWSEGLSPEWVYGVLSSDELFVKDETKRYEAAKRVVELRRRVKGIVDHEE